MRERIAPFHISWGWQVHTDVILSLETFARPCSRFICGSLAGLHRRDGWSGRRWRPVKHQPPELWEHLSIKSLTGYTTACRGRLVTVNSHNWPRTAASRWRWRWGRIYSPLWWIGWSYLSQLSGRLDAMTGKYRMHIYLWGTAAFFLALARSY